MTQVVEALRYKPEGRGFDSRWGNFIDLILRPDHEPGVDSESNGNDYQGYLLVGKGGWCVGLKPYFMCRLSRNSGSLKLLKPYGLC